MLRRASVLSAAWALVLMTLPSPTMARGGSLPAIQELKGVRPKPSVFRAAGRQKPLVLRTEKDAAEHFGGTALDTLLGKVDFKQQLVLVFAWRGSGQDRLTYSVAESYPEQVTFTLRPGRTRDLRPHVKVYVLRSNVTWQPPKRGGRHVMPGGRPIRPGGRPIRPGGKPNKLPADGPPAAGSSDDAAAALRKHPRYREIYQAKNVVVATLDKAEVTAVAESFPPIFRFDLTLTVAEALRGSFQPKQQIRCTYSKSARTKPSLPVGKKCLVLLRSAPRAHHAYSLEPASDDLLKIARQAAKDADKAGADAAAIARDKPEKHPLYAGFKQAEGVLVATSDPSGAVSFSRQGTTTQSQICVASLKGSLKKGERFTAVFPAAVAPEGKLPDDKFLLLAYKSLGGPVVVTCVAEASDTNLRVAAAATGTPPRTHKALEAATHRADRGPSRPACRALGSGCGCTTRPSAR